MFDNLKNIENYYKNRITEKTNFEAFRVLPSTILILGTRYDRVDSCAVWIATGMFFDILSAIESKNIKKISRIEINSLLLFFKKNCLRFGIQGILDKSFHKVFPDPSRQELMLDLFVSLSGDQKKFILGNYLKNCVLTEDGCLNVVHNIIKLNHYDFGHIIFTQIGAEFILEALMSNTSLEMENWVEKLSIFNNYVSYRKLMSKTWLLVLEHTIALLDSK